MPRKLSRKPKSAAIKKGRGYDVISMDVFHDTKEDRYLHVDRIEEHASDPTKDVAVCGQRKGTTGRWTVIKDRVPAKDLRSERFVFHHHEGPNRS